MAGGFTTAEPHSQHHCIYLVLWTGNFFLKSVAAWPHFSSLKWRLCIALSQTEDAPQVQLVCSSCRGVWGPDHSRPKGHLSFMATSFSPAVLLHCSVPTTASFVQQWYFHPFLYLQSPLEKNSTNPRACLWLSSNEAKQSSCKYCSWQSVAPLRLDQADFSSAELQWHSPGEWSPWHDLEHQRTALSPLLSGSGCPSWQLLASSCCIQGRSSQTCIHHSCSHQSFLD